MKLGIMQPYFLPYLGYISLIKHTDKFILLDHVQFIRHGWIERNRILKPDAGWQYIKVPLQKHSRETKIKDVVINNELQWKNKTLAQLQHYKKAAPYFNEVIEVLQNIYTNEYKSIGDLNLEALRLTCSYLGISKPIEIFSKMSLDIDTVTVPDEWALNICKAIPGITEYWNPPGGMKFFDKSKFSANKINLKFHKIVLIDYPQIRSTFEPGLSIIDVMMFNSVEQINLMLDSYELH